MVFVFEITAAHAKPGAAIGHSLIARQARCAQIPLGQILPCDVGKRVFKVGRVFQVESSEQRDRRLGVSASEMAAQLETVKEVLAEIRNEEGESK